MSEVGCMKVRVDKTCSLMGREVKHGRVIVGERRRVKESVGALVWME